MGRHDLKGMLSNFNKGVKNNKNGKPEYVSQQVHKHTVNSTDTITKYNV
jgi:hypothetical protein